jgi:hypothetical protein
MPQLLRYFIVKNASDGVQYSYGDGWVGNREILGNMVFLLLVLFSHVVEACKSAGADRPYLHTSRHVDILVKRYWRDRGFHDCAPRAPCEHLNTFGTAFLLTSDNTGLRIHYGNVIQDSWHTKLNRYTKLNRSL